MANGLLAKNGLIVTGSVEVQNAVTASTFSGDGSGLSGVSDFPYTGSAIISGSLEVIGDTNFTGSINFLNNSTNRIYFENAASITQPQIRLRTHNTGITMRGNDVLALMSNGSGMIGMKKTSATSINFPSAAKVGFTTNTSVEAYNPETYFRRYSSGVIGIGYGAVTSANLSGSLILTNITASGHVSASTYYGDGSNLTGISSDPFPYTGDVEITGSNSLAGNYALKVANSSGNNIFVIGNEGHIGVNTTPSSTYTFYIDDGATTSNTLFVNSYNRIGWSGGAGQWLSGWSARLAFYIGGGGGGEVGRFTTQGEVNSRLVVKNAVHLGENSGDNGDTRFTRLDTGTVAIGNSADDASGTLYVGNLGVGNVTGSLTHTLEVTGDVSASTYYGDGSNLTGISSDPFPYTGSAIISGSLSLEGSGSTIFDVVGSQGQLFSITDSLSGSLFAVSDITGLPILEVFSDDTVKIGSFNNEAIIISGSNATITGSFTGSFTGDGSNLTGIETDPFPYTGSAIISGSLDITGSAIVNGDITTNTLSNISTTLASDSATNVDTFATATYTGAIYDYTLVDTTVGARAGQFMVAQDNGSITFTDTSTEHLFDPTIPEITAQINGANVEVQVTNGDGYTFKSFTKKL